MIQYLIFLIIQVYEWPNLLSCISALWWKQAPDYFVYIYCQLKVNYTKLITIISLSPYSSRENFSNIRLHPIPLSLLTLWWQDSLLLLENKTTAVQIMHAQLQFSSVWGSLSARYSLFMKCFICKSVLKVWIGTLCFYQALSYRFCFHSGRIIF